jgi:hypothetical protein
VLHAATSRIGLGTAAARDELVRSGYRIPMYITLTGLIIFILIVLLIVWLVRRV